MQTSTLFVVAAPNRVAHAPLLSYTPRHCYSFGNSTIAACGADVKQDAIWPAFSNRTAMAIVMASGMLMQFPGNPAVNATPYVEQCSNLTVT